MHGAVAEQAARSGDELDGRGPHIGGDGTDRVQPAQVPVLVGPLGLDVAGVEPALMAHLDRGAGLFDDAQHLLRGCRRLRQRLLAQHRDGRLRGPHDQRCVVGGAHGDHEPVQRHVEEGVD